VITEQQPAFLIDGLDSIGTQGGTVADDQLTVALDQETDGKENNFGERGRESRFVSLFDFFASTPRNSVLALTDAGTTSSWYAIEGGWDSARGVELVVDDAGQTAALDVADDQNVHHNVTLDLTDPTEIQVIGHAAAQRLLRVVASPHTLFPDANCACGEGETAGQSGTTGAVSRNVAPPLPSASEGEAVRGLNTSNQLLPTFDAAFATAWNQPPAVTATKDPVVERVPPVTVANTTAVDLLMDAPQAHSIAWTRAADDVLPINDAEYTASVDIALTDFFASTRGDL